MFSATGHWNDAFDFFELLITVEILESIKPRASRCIWFVFIEDAFAVDIYVKPIFCVQQALGHSEVHVDRFNFGSGSVRSRARSDSIEFTVLIGNNQSTFEIHAHGNPRALVFGRDLVDEVDLKTFGKPEGICRSSPETFFGRPFGISVLSDCV